MTDNNEKLIISRFTEEARTELAELFKTFGDVTRLRILEALAEKGEICVNDLAEGLSMTQSAVSHQLKVLKQTRLVRSRRDGRQIYYALDDEHVHSILSKGMEHVLEH